MLQTAWRLIYPHAKCSFHSHFSSHRSIFQVGFLHFSKPRLSAELPWWLIALMWYLAFESFWFRPALALMRHLITSSLWPEWKPTSPSLHWHHCFTTAHLSPVFNTYPPTAFILSYFSSRCHPHPLYHIHSHLLTVHLWELWLRHLIWSQTEDLWKVIIKPVRVRWKLNSRHSDMRPWQL